MKLSVLDLIPVHRGQSSAQAVTATRSAARLADRLGYHRYWFAEHHNMPSVASTTPPVITAVVAGETERMRLGSGGVMLPNHSPFVVAEQFAMLEAVAPGRIDLGIGRAPGSDPVITALLHASGATSDVERFPEFIDQIIALIGPSGAQLQIPSRAPYTVKATPAAVTEAAVWLLGSSQYSAQLAAQLGLPYVFAHHFSGGGADMAMAIYRSRFTPSLHLDAPLTFMTVNVSVADTTEEAHERALPNLQQMARLRTGKPLGPLDNVDEARLAAVDAMGQQVIDDMQHRWIIGDPEQASKEIRALAEQFAVDEVMLSLSVSPRADEPLDRWVAREHALELLATEFDLA